MTEHLAPALPEGVADLDAGQALDLARRGAVRVLDVREPGEHIASHIPGATLIPLGLLERRFMELDREASWLVHCEHGIRSIQAIRLLHGAGFRRLYHLAGGISRWPGERGCHTALFENTEELRPNGWLLEHLEVLPRGRALDVACGRGRNALALAYFGWEVEGVDHAPDRLAVAADRARALNLPVTTRLVDLETGENPLAPDSFDLALVVHYLHRDLFPWLRAAVRPGGAVVCETFTREHRERFGRPSNPDHLLEPGELRRRFEDWEILDAREGEAGPEARMAVRMVASIVARRPEGA